MNESIEQIYDELAQPRETLIERCEGYAEWTLPSIFPRSGTTTEDELQYDVQSFGAQAVNHLSNKLMIGLFNPSKSFFRLDAAQEFIDEMGLIGVTPELIQSALQGAERESVKELDRLGAREPFTMLLQLLIITGNALLHFPKTGKLEVHTMRDYVIERDITGFVTRMILLDTKKFRTLTKETQDRLLAIKPTYKPTDDVKLYTDVLWDNDRKKYIVHQHAHNVQITDEKTKGVYTKDTVPYIPLVWKVVRGQNWGKGLVEDYAGDFHSLSTAERSSLEIVGLLAQIKGLVDPSGLTDVNELNSTVNGAWCSGRADDVELLTFDKLFNTMGALETYIDKKERRLSKAFLMDAAGIRNAERVTAEEIRLIARDLEMALGGVYTRLAQTFQLPVAKLLLARIDFKIKGEQVEPIITTGLTALSRSGDLDSYRLFLQDASLLGAVDEGVRAELDIPSILSFLATNNNFDLDVAFKSPEQKEQDRQAQAAAEEQAIQDEVRMQAEPKLIEQQNEAQ